MGRDAKPYLDNEKQSSKTVNAEAEFNLKRVELNSIVLFAIHFCILL